MRKLAIFTAAFALSAAVFVYVCSAVWLLWIAAGCILLSILVRKLGLRRASIVSLGLCVGLLWCLTYKQIWLKDAYAMHNTEQTVSVRIMDQPYATAYGAAAQCKLDRYNGILYADRTLLKASTGDTVVCAVEIETLAEDRDCLANGRVLKLAAIEKPTIVEGKANLYESVRINLQERIDAIYTQPEAGLVKAILTGSRKDLTFEMSNMLSVAGLSHAVAVSGMHVSILLTMIAVLCGKQPRLTAVLGVPVVVVFALATGASASVCRAAVMQIMLLCAPLARRERDGITSLATSALLLLIQNPWCIADISFQLSFAAVVGLIVFSEPIRKRIVSLRKHPGKVLKFIASMASATLSASVTTLPLVALYFGVASIVAVIVNLLTLWAVTGIFVLGLCSCILAGPGVWVAWVNSLLCRYVFGVCKVVTLFPYAAAYEENLPLMIWAVLAHFLIVGAILLKWASPRWIASIVCASFLCCVIGAHMGFMRPPWRLTVLDVGQGQCLVLRIGTYTAVIDCGGSDPEQAGEDAARYLHGAGITHIDSLILTHYDLDHAGGAVQFLSRVRTDCVYLPPAPEAETIDDRIEEVAPQVQFVSDCLQIDFEAGNITIFPPISDENANNSGITILATTEECDMLITGDLDEDTEMKLIKTYDLPHVEILVAGHHGARTSTSQALLLKTRPKIVAISAGEDNRYGHPHQETLKKLEAMDIEIYRTDRQGTIYFMP